MCKCCFGYGINDLIILKLSMCNSTVRHSRLLGRTLWVTAIVFVLVSLLYLYLKSSHNSDAKVDALNAASYSNHYRSLRSTASYASCALNLARKKGYVDGEAEALNNLAFVALAEMNFGRARRLLDSVRQTTNNHIELLVADVQMMRLCQRCSANKEFYHVAQSAAASLRRIDEDASLLTMRQQRRMDYARSEYAIVMSTYLYYVGLRNESSQVLMSLDMGGEMSRDTAQTLAYLYNVGAGGVLKASSHARLQQFEFDYLMRCYMLSRQYRYTYWEANSLQAISEHIQQKSDRQRLRANNEQEFDYVNLDRMPDSLLAGNLAQRALTLFQGYGDVYQTAGSWRTLSEAYRALGDYESALACLNKALHSNASIKAAPDLVASIREQLSIVYSAMNDKHASDYNRNLYLDLQERTRQDRQLEARAEQLSSSLRELDMMIVAVLVMIVVVLGMLIWFAVWRHRHHADFAPQLVDDAMNRWREHAKDVDGYLSQQIEDIEEATIVGKQQVSNYRRRAIEQRAKVSLATTVLSIISRMLHELHRLESNMKPGACGETDSVVQMRSDYLVQCLATIETYNSRLTQWIQLRQGDFRLHVESFPVAKLFSDLRKSAPEYRLRGITLDVSDTDAFVKADRTLTFFMLNTITENARRFTPNGGTVSVEASTTDSYVEISITDNGCGMDKDTLANLFTRHPLHDDTYMSGVPSVNDGGGHGFGLLNCKGIIDKYRKLSPLFSVCSIGATSEVGKGSRFFFRLPRGVSRVVMLLVAIFSFLCSTEAAPQNASKSTLACWKKRAAAYADSAYFSNVNGDYSQSITYADSCLHCLNTYVGLAYPYRHVTKMKLSGDYPSAAAELGWLRDSLLVDFGVVLDIRNETAVAALALHRWQLYSYNNAVYTQVFRERSADNTLPSYVKAMQKAETDRSVAIGMLVMLFVMIFPIYYLLYYRRLLYYHRWVARLKLIMDLITADKNMSSESLVERIDEIWKAPVGIKKSLRNDSPPADLDIQYHRIKNMVDAHSKRNAELKIKCEIEADSLRRLEMDRDRLYVSNNVLEGCLSSLKHETMYYPSRLRQLIVSGDNIPSACQLAEYYRLVYTTLLANATCTVRGVRRLVICGDAIVFLRDILKHKNNGQLPEYAISNISDGYILVKVHLPNLKIDPNKIRHLFTPLTHDTDFLVCCQIVRDAGDIAGARACGIEAQCEKDKSTLITIKITEQLWKNSLS